MRMFKIVICVIGCLFIFSNCDHENKKFDKFYETEKERIINITSELLEKIGLENFEIIVYTNRSINNRIVSKSMSDTNWNGKGYNPEGPNDSKDLVYKDISDHFGWMRQRTLTANYELNAKREISYDNFSIIIIFEKISQSKENELSRILDSLIINTERGDNLLIISKEDFNKL